MRRYRWTNPQPWRPAAAAGLADLAPDVLLVDQADVAENSLLALLCHHQDLIALGLDVSRNVLTPLSPHQHPFADLPDLMRVLGEVR